MIMGTTSFNAIFVYTVPILVKRIIHYLDDFFFLGPPGSVECMKSLKLALETCAELGVPVVPHKVEGPASRVMVSAAVASSFTP